MKPSTLAFGILTASAVHIIISEMTKTTQRKKRIKKRHDHPSQHHTDWNCVDEASWESFPASDPPGKY